MRVQMNLQKLIAVAAMVAAFPGFIVAQTSQLASDIEQAKKLSSMTGRPILAVAGEAAN